MYLYTVYYWNTGCCVQASCVCQCMRKSTVISLLIITALMTQCMHNKIYTLRLFNSGFWSCVFPVGVIHHNTPMCVFVTAHFKTPHCVSLWLCVWIWSTYKVHTSLCWQEGLGDVRRQPVEWSKSKVCMIITVIGLWLYITRYTYTQDIALGRE